MTDCFKVSGSGNDFLALVEPDEDPSPERIRAWCARGLSLGADGLFVLRRTPGGAAMRYFNADGREAALCINGTRCAARLAFHLGWVHREITIATGAGLLLAREVHPALPRAAPPLAARAASSPGAHEAGHVGALARSHAAIAEAVEDRPLHAARRPAGEIGAAPAREEHLLATPPLGESALAATAIALTLPFRAEAPVARRLALDGRAWEGWEVAVGVPHLVLLWPETLATAPVATLGPRLRSHPDLGPAGANVDFVRFPAPHRLEIRSFERGVEAETLACGTGVVAAAATGVALGLASLPLVALTQGGFELEVSSAVSWPSAPSAAGSPGAPGSPAAGPDQPPWTLTGDARLLWHGTALPDAEVPAPAPHWSP